MDRLARDDQRWHIDEDDPAFRRLALALAAVLRGLPDDIEARVSKKPAPGARRGREAGGARVTTRRRRGKNTLLGG